MVTDENSSMNIMSSPTNKLHIIYIMKPINIHDPYFPRKACSPNVCPVL